MCHFHLVLHHPRIEPTTFLQWAKSTRPDFGPKELIICCAIINHIQIGELYENRGKKVLFSQNKWNATTFAAKE